MDTIVQVGTGSEDFYVILTPEIAAKVVGLPMNEVVDTLLDECEPALISNTGQIDLYVSEGDDEENAAVFAELQRIANGE